MFIDHTLLEGRNATCVTYFQLPSPKTNEFKLHLKESLLIKRDVLELKRNSYIHPLELSA